MKHVLNEFVDHGIKYGLLCTQFQSVLPVDESTLFITAGMQRYKPYFKDDKLITEKDARTMINVQRCLRTNDLEAISDGTHAIVFDMLGLFSFRDWSLEQGIEFWYEFVAKKLGLPLRYVTVHPNKYAEWKKHYKMLQECQIKCDSECVWSDGDMGGYCTKFYVDGIEVGNIVNPPMGDNNCLDCGFGLERLSNLVNGTTPATEEQVLTNAIRTLIDDGIRPTATGKGYVLRKLLRKMVIKNYKMNDPIFITESERQSSLKEQYHRLTDKPHLKDKSREWWFDTYGIDLDLIT